ncbi:MAG: serine/threonine-protein kinase [Deltaproteobacteria bacterium]|nr:serine/threonine-protein kinase [Deltaproteobacteria bacterium]
MEAFKSQGQGEAFGRYRLRGLLGQGGMGQLFVAEQQGIQGFSKIVAVKRILPHLANSPQFEDMFLNEARMAARLEHPNIVATYELGEADGSYFISMEYLPGEDLAAILLACQRSEPMTVEIAVALTQQSANGLHYAHDIREPSGKPVGLVHRDVNPSNIFVTYYGMVKLLDFGIVKNAPGSTQTSPGVFKGKYAYCAPEQITGGDVDRRTDIFSLGIVLWEALTNRSLFAKPNDAQTMDAVRSQTIAAPSTLRPDVPRDLDAITMRALSRDPRARFQSAHELSEALDAFLVQRQQRPTSKSIGLWMESLFEPNRAALKKAIAQGTEVEAALEQLKVRRLVTAAGMPAPGRSLSAQPRALWSTQRPSADHVATERISGGQVGAADAAVPRAGLRASAETPLPATEVSRAASHGATHITKRSRTPVWMIAAGTAAVVAIVVGFSLRQEAPRWAGSTQQTTTMGAIEVQSDPSGAIIFVDGEPSGLTTPAVLRGLKVGRQITLHLDKAGYKTEDRRLSVVAGKSPPQVFKMIESDGRVVLRGLPAEARVYVDDVEMPGAAQPFMVPVGEHRLRVESADQVVFSQQVQIKPGEQIVSIKHGRTE